MHEDFRELVDLVSGPAAAEMELRLFRQLLALGLWLLGLSFTARAADKPAAPVAPDLTPLRECHHRSTTYPSMFGKIRFKRHRFYALGQRSISRLDAHLSLPRRCYSDLLRDWAGHELVDAAYDQGARTIEHILGIGLSKQALEILVAEDAAHMEGHYDHKPPPPATSERPVLLVQAD